MPNEKTAKSARVTKAKKPQSDAPKPPKNLKKRILVTLFVIFNVAIILWTAFSEFGDSENAARLEDVEINIWLLLPAILLFLIGFGAEIYKNILMTRKCGDQKDWRVGARTVILGRYYDNITPAAVGGQPFQIHYMHTHGVKHGYAAIIPVVSLISTQLGFIIVAVFSYLFFGHLVDPAYLGLGVLGLIFYAIFPAGVTIATFFPKLLSEIISWVVKLLAKIHIVKDEEEAVEKTKSSIDNYANCVKKIAKNRTLVLQVLGLSVVFHVCITMIPYFVLHAFGGSLSFFMSFTTTLAITAAVYITPTPGNSGFAEGFFFAVFKSLASGYVFWAMLFWRMLTYYSYIFLGIIVYSLIAYETRTGRYFFTDAKKYLRKLRQKSQKNLPERRKIPDEPEKEAEKDAKD